MFIYLCSNSGSLPGNLLSGSTTSHIYFWHSHAVQVNTSHLRAQLRTGSNTSARPPPGPRARASGVAPTPPRYEGKTAGALPDGERPGASRGHAAGGSGSQAPPPGPPPASPPSRDSLSSPWPCQPPVSASAPLPPRPCGGQAGGPEEAAGPRPHPPLLQLSQRRGHRTFGHGRPNAFSPPASALPPTARRPSPALANKRAGVGPPSRRKEGRSPGIGEDRRTQEASQPMPRAAVSLAPPTLTN